MAEGIASSEGPGRSPGTRCIGRARVRTARFRHRTRGQDHDRTLSIIEAVMLAVVALLAGTRDRLGQVEYRVISAIGPGIGGAVRGEPRRNAEKIKNFDSRRSTPGSRRTSQEPDSGSRRRPPLPARFQGAFDAWIAELSRSPMPRRHPAPPTCPSKAAGALAPTGSTGGDEDYTLGVEAGSSRGRWWRGCSCQHWNLLVRRACSPPSPSCRAHRR